MENCGCKCMAGRYEGYLVIITVFMLLSGCAAQFTVKPELNQKHAKDGRNATLVFTIFNVDKTKKKVSPSEIQVKIQVPRNDSSEASSLFLKGILRNGRMEIQEQNTGRGFPLERYKGRGRMQYKAPNVEFYLIHVSQDDFGWNYIVKAIDKAKRQLGDENEGKTRLLQAVEPEIYSSPSLFPKNVMKLGDNRSFTCRADGTPKPRVKWIVQGKKKVEGTEKAVMKIVNAKSGDTDNYICRAENVGGVAKETMSLIVSYIEYAEGDARSEVIHIKKGGEVNTKCNIGGYPIPKYEWLDTKGKVIRTTKEFQSGSFDLFGNYTCKAINAFGTLKYVVQVKEKGTNVTKSPEPKVLTQKSPNNFAPARKKDSLLVCILHSTLVVVFYLLT